MLKLELRLANAGDAVALIKHDKHISERIITEKISRNEIYVACDDDKFIGWLRYSLFWDTIPFMNMLYLLPEYRGKGVGRKFVQFWENEMKRLDYKKFMTSTQQNEQAQHFYVALGYVAVGGFIQTSGTLLDESFEIILVKN